MKLSHLHGEYVYMLLLTQHESDLSLIKPYKFISGTQDESDLYTFRVT